MAKNKDRRYRFNADIARKLGIDPNTTGQYRLDKETEKIYLNLDMSEPIKRLFYDIETSPEIVYTWRTGYKLNIPASNIIEDWKIICVSWSWNDEDVVHNLKWNSRKRCDKSLVKKFIKVLNEADEIIAHNGDRFDIKKIRTRALVHRIPMRPRYKSFDTYKKAKHAFAMDSYSLNNIAKLLGVNTKINHEGFAMWVKCMQGDKKTLEDMIKYCDMDIVVLKDVFREMQNYLINNVHTGVTAGRLKHSCPNCGSETATLLDNSVTAKGTIKRIMECNSCSYNYEISNRAFLNMLEMIAKEKNGI